MKKKRVIKNKKGKKEKKEDYISLQEATRYCNYSQEYLSLRARRGKLKAVKKGRNWVTTLVWLADYLKRVEDYKTKITKKNSIQQKPENSEEEILIALNEEKEFYPLPPSNLPVEGFQDEIEKDQKIRFSLQFGFVLTLSFILLTLAFFYYKKETSDIIFALLRFSYKLEEVQDYLFGSLEEILPDYFKWIGKQINNISYYINK